MYKIIKFSFTILICLLILINNCNCDSQQQQQQQQQQQNEDNNWEQDLSDTFKIEGSDLGIQKVNLKCGAERMYIELETEKDFTGVMYTRGSFHKQTEPCFMKPNTERGARLLKMEFQFDQCQTIQDGDIYSNIVVIQNDPELITPGDSAFSLECDFRKPRNLQVEAEMQTRDRIASGSRITMASPDPAASIDLNSKETIFSNTNQCSYIPKHKRYQQNQQQHDHDHVIHIGSVEEIPIEQERQIDLEKDEL